MTLANAFWRANEGSSVIEYALIASCVSAGLVGSADFFTGLADSPLASMNAAITIYVDEDSETLLSDQEIMDISLAALGFRSEG